MYRTVDLFAGVGGIRKGFEMSGFFENALSAEFDKYAAKTYEHLYGEDPFNDVTDEAFKKKVEETSYSTLLAGFPCQAFSRAGKQEGFLNATKGTLFFDVADIIKRTKPKTFLLENVDNLLSHDKGNTFKVIAETLVNELGYKVIGIEEDGKGGLSWDNSSFKRNSRNFGVPQNRPRVYLMGFNKEYFGDALKKLDGKELPVRRERDWMYKDLHDLIELGAADPKYYIADGYMAFLKAHRERHASKGNGFGYIVVNEPSRKDPVSNAILATGGSGRERNLILDPQEGIAGQVHKSKKTPLNSEGIRLMTPHEWAKLQGFANYAFKNDDGSDGFGFPEGMSDAQKFKQMGNSVTIPVIEELAIFMRDAIWEMKPEDKSA